MKRERGKEKGQDHVKNHLLRFYKVMDEHFGDLHWWPGDSTLEILIGAVLTQNTAWRNVERVIGNLKGNDFVHIRRILKTERAVLEEMLRPAGIFRIKAERLTNLLRFIDEEYAGELEKMFAEEIWSLRKKLLAIQGIGEETADCMLLYGGGKPIFVVDAYTRRILERHDLIRRGATYGEIQSLFMKHLPAERALFGQYHALLVEVGKAFCRKIPQCGSCPLGCFLTAGKLNGEKRCYSKSKI